jgi:hypothetical protein
MGHAQKYASLATILAYASEILTSVSGAGGIIFTEFVAAVIISIKILYSLIIN